MCTLNHTSIINNEDLCNNKACQTEFTKKEPSPTISGPPFTAAGCASDGKKHLLLCATGSVAAIKIPEILRSLSGHLNLSIRLIFSKSATYFLNGLDSEISNLFDLRHFSNVDGIYLDKDEWAYPWRRGNAILHIELRRWADIMVIAPLSANTLAKIANGLADNLVTCVVRAWEIGGAIHGSTHVKRIVVAPAMNTAMWRHPITKKHLAVLEGDWGIRESQGIDGTGEQGWFEVLRPIKKLLACGDLGDGAMSEWSDIVGIIQHRLEL